MAPAPAGVGSVDITLITGDTVRVAKDAAGKTTVDVVDAVSTSFRGQSGPDGTYLYPDTAEAAVASGQVDRELFNVEYLAANGYDDASMKAVPVIVDFGAARTAAATRQGVQTLAAAKPGRSLETLGASGVSVDKAQAQQFWNSLTGAAKMRAASMQKVWLDRKVSVALDVSVPQIGAPQAWQAGYDGTGTKVAVLDTGIDATHPDLAGKVIASESFVPGESVVDGNGHGTHVAATIVGSGAASGGTHKGVAPGAKLVVGKVLSNGGEGLDSWIIDAMEWAAVDQDSDIISMSLGGGLSDGTDLMSAAVDVFTLTYGALFVIAAGNSGPAEKTVSSPGAAATALTVGAVDKDNRLANFSSRGPLPNNFRIKPEITAPGVGIVAARAAGTAMGTPVDDHYTSANGTSMATPHVAGAAAIVAQQYPDWTPDQIKAHLVSTAADGGYIAWQQGAGRVDVAKAVGRQLTVDTTAISPGMVPTGDGPSTTTVTYSNPTDSDQTLTMTHEVGTDAGAPAPAGLVTVEPASVTVPAGGTASVKVTINDQGAELGGFSGALTATSGDGATVRTPIGFWRVPELATLTVRLMAPVSASARGFYYPNNGSIVRVDDQELPWFDHLITRETDDPDVHVATVRVPSGRYQISFTPVWNLASAIDFYHFAWVEEPEVVVEGDTEWVMDLRELQPVTVATDKPSQIAWHVEGSGRHTASGEYYASYRITTLPNEEHSWRLPTRTTPTTGTFYIKNGYILTEPEAVFRTGSGRSRTTLNPIYADWGFSGERRSAQHEFLQDANLGVASWADVVAGRDTRGKLAYIDMSDVTEGPCSFGGQSITCEIANRVMAATNAGAAAVVTSTGGVRVRLADIKYALDYLGAGHTIPVLWLQEEQAAQLAAMLDGADLVTIDVDAAPNPSYEYKLWFFEHGQVPARPLAYTANSRDLKRIDASYHSEQLVTAGDSARDRNHTLYRDADVSFAMVRPFYAQTSRVEYHSVTGPDVLDMQTVDFKVPGTTDGWRPHHLNRTVTDRRADRYIWNPATTPLGQPRPSGPPAQEAAYPYILCAACRQGDKLWLTPQPVTGDGRLFQTGIPFQPRLFQDDKEIPVDRNGFFPMPEEAQRYRMDLVTADRGAGSAYANNTHTTWNFTSTPRPETDEVHSPYWPFGEYYLDTTPAAYQPVIFLGYDIPLDLDNTAKADRPLWFTVHASSPRPGSGGDVRGMTVQASYDDGKTWTNATYVRRAGEGQFQVFLKHPKLSRTTGAVTLRVKAWDHAGNDVVQTITRAYGLRDPGPERHDRIPRGL